MAALMGKRTKLCSLIDCFFAWKSSVLRIVSILRSILEMLNIDWLYWIIENTMKKNTTFQWYIMSSQKVVDLHICLLASSSWFFEYVVMALEHITRCIQPSSNPYQWISTSVSVQLFVIVQLFVNVHLNANAVFVSHRDYTFPSSGNWLWCTKTFA